MQYRQHRYPTGYPVALHSPSGTHQVRIIDVNAAGARIVCPVALGRGTKIQITVLSQRVDCRVCWTHNGTIGVKFQPALTDNLIDTLRYRRDKRPPSGPGRVGFQFAMMR